MLFTLEGFEPTTFQFRFTKHKCTVATHEVGGTEFCLEIRGKGVIRVKTIRFCYQILLNDLIGVHEVTQYSGPL